MTTPAPTPAGVAPTTDHQIALVRERSPIADVVAEHVQLVDAGEGNLTGLCPFHQEKTPSFNVTPARGYWYCFGCAEGGDVIAFVRKLEHLSFGEAVERLTGRADARLARETAEYIASELTPCIAQAREGFTVVYADDRRPPTDVEEIAANLLDGVLWVSWMDDRVLGAMRTLHGEPTGDAAFFA